MRLAKDGKNWVTPSMIVQIGFNNNHRQKKIKISSPIYLGLTVTKRVGNAVVRNRVKRRLKSAAYSLLPEITNDENEIVIIGRKQTLNKPFSTLLADLQWAIRKLGEVGNEKY